MNLVLVEADILGADMASSLERGISTSSVDTELIERILKKHSIFNDDDVVFVGGSVADGLATPWSDVDVFVIRNSVGVADTGLHLVPMPHDEIPMDLEVWSTGEVVLLLNKLRELCTDSQTNHRAFMRLTEDEREFLHCLVCAIPVYNEVGLLRLQAEVDRDLLARLSIARALVGISNSQTDLLGWLDSGDWQSVGTACQRLLDFSALAMLGAIGCTHPGGKWLTSLLRSHFQDKPLPPRLLSGAANLVDRFYALQLKPAHPEAVYDYARECVNFSNLAIVYAQTVGVGILDHLLQQIFWLPELPLLPLNDQVRPSLSCGAQIRFCSGEWYLLHVGREMYQVNATAIGMILLIDGRTTEQEILDVMEGLSSADGNQLARSLRDLLMFLENANLLSE